MSSRRISSVAADALVTTKGRCATGPPSATRESSSNKRSTRGGHDVVLHRRDRILQFEGRGNVAAKQRRRHAGVTERDAQHPHVIAGAADRDLRTVRADVQ